MSFVEDLRFAAVQGDAEAQFCLSNCYSRGYGVEKDYKKAALWLVKAAKQGVAGAQFNLGVWYANGIGVNRDVNSAKLWFRKASEQGNELAQEYLEKYFKH